MAKFKRFAFFTLTAALYRALCLSAALSRYPHYQPTGLKTTRPGTR